MANIWRKIGVTKYIPDGGMMHFKCILATRRLIFAEANGQYFELARLRNTTPGLTSGIGFTVHVTKRHPRLIVDGMTPVDVRRDIVKAPTKTDDMVLGKNESFVVKFNKFDADNLHIIGDKKNGETYRMALFKNPNDKNLLRAQNALIEKRIAYFYVKFSRDNNGVLSVIMAKSEHDVSNVSADYMPMYLVQQLADKHKNNTQKFVQQQMVEVFNKTGIIMAGTPADDIAYILANGDPEMVKQYHKNKTNINTEVAF